MRNLGTIIERIAKPTGTVIDAVTGTDLKNCGGCKKMVRNLDGGMSVRDAIYERWFKAKQKGEQMKYKLTVVVEAKSGVEAMQKGESIGEVSNLQALSPEQPQRTVPQGLMPAPMIRQG